MISCKLRVPVGAALMIAVGISAAQSALTAIDIPRMAGVIGRFVVSPSSDVYRYPVMSGWVG